VQDVDMVTVQG